MPCIPGTASTCPQPESGSTDPHLEVLSNSAPPFLAPFTFNPLTHAHFPQAPKGCPVPSCQSPPRPAPLTPAPLTPRSPSHLQPSSSLSCILGDAAETEPRVAWPWPPQPSLQWQAEVGLEALLAVA